VKTITFEVQLTAGSSPVDLSTGHLTVAYTSSDKVVANAYSTNSSDAGVYITPLTGSGSVLNAGYTYQVTINATGTAINDAGALGAYSSFTIELKPTVGSVLTIERTLPSAITATMNLN
jgi:archaellin